VYDAKQEAHEFFGADRSEAVEKACQFFEVAEADLRIGELPEGEVFGAGGRAVVVAVPRNARPPRGGGNDRDRDGDRDRDRGRGGRDRDRGRDRGRGRDRDRGRGRDRDRGRQEAREEPRFDDDAPSEPREVRSATGPSKGAVTGKLSEIGTFVCGLLERLELGPFEIVESEDGDNCIIQLSGAGAQELAREDGGRAVDAAQLLANQAALRLADEPPRVVLDVEGDREGREEYLEELAQRAARRALKIGRPVALDPMNGRSRRILHISLRETDDVATMSTGEGSYRQVVVVPKGAQEYEEAVRSSEEAARSED
jgi:spoIIIJ-associated protein